jgi:RimJ/RimL family protein N-acetyltransferase
MPDIETSRLSLHPVDVVEARRIVERAPTSEDRWAADYPFEGDLAGLGAFLAASERAGEQRPFGYYRISLRASGQAVGGIGFKGAPVDGVVEVGYGLAPSARGQGLAAEALTALVATAAGHGVVLVRADTVPANLASIRTLEHAGFTRVAADADLLIYEVTTAIRANPSQTSEPSAR